MPFIVVLSVLRWIVGLPLAAGITVILFLLMSGVVATGDPQLGEPRPPIEPITATIPDEPERRSEENPIDIIPGDPPPPVDTRDRTITDDFDTCKRIGYQCQNR